jgi:hypothetical protein
MTTDVELGNLYQPHQGQSYVHAQDTKVKVLKIGRRWGKSRFALWELIRRFTEALEIEVTSALVPPFHAWILAPSYPQSRQVWNELISFFPTELVASGGIRQDDKTIYLKGSEKRGWGFIEVKSGHDPDALQTAGLDFLWITEAQDIKDAAFQKVLPTLRSPERLGYAVFEGIPSTHADHWFERICRQAEDGREGYFYHHASTFDNPLLDDQVKAEIEGDKEILTESSWRRLYLAEFSEDSGYFKSISSAIGGDLLSEPMPGTEYVAGLDLGRKVDASVIHILDAQDRRVVFHMVWDQGTNWVTQREMITKIAREWGVSRLVLDATGMGGDMFTAELQEAGLPVEPYIITAASRENLLQGLSLGLDRETIRFPPIPGLLRQLRAFQYRKMPSGTYRAEAPPGEHDDEVFALALALTACASAPSLMPTMSRLGSRRYGPTQQEANDGTFLGGKFSRRHRDMILERIRKRHEERGIT